MLTSPTFNKILLGNALVLGFGTMMTSFSATAHEYWLTPNSFMSKDQALTLQAYVGEGLESDNRQVFNDDTSSTFWINGHSISKDSLLLSDDKKSVALSSDVMASTPVFSIAHETDAAIHVHQTLEDFKQFTEEEGAPEIYQQHLDADLPKAQFNEIFYRHTKTLLCDSNADSSDSDSELSYEWVALDNPYVAKEDELSFQLTFNNEPVTSSPVVVFIQQSENGSVERHRFTTDEEGKINLTNQPAKYLINATVIQRTATKTMVSTGAIWQSDWVSLVFNTQKPCV